MGDLNCGKCRYFDTFIGEKGMCRFFPPIWLGEDTGWGFPEVVAIEDWCGKFEPNAAQ